MRGTLPALVLVATLLMPSSAFACRYLPGTEPVNTDGTLEDPFVLAMIGAALVDVTFFALDIGYAADGRSLPEGVAIAQVVVASLGFAGSAVLGASGFMNMDSCATQDRPLHMWGASVALSAAATALLAHAVRGLESPWMPTLALDMNGMQLGLAGRF